MVPGVHVEPYEIIYKHESELGYIVWRRGPGEAVELLQLFASEIRKGHGTALVRIMVDQLVLDGVSYKTVYGFTRERLIQAQVFYLSLGFTLIRIPGYYREGSAVLFSQTLENLLERLNVS